MNEKATIRCAFAYIHAHVAQVFFSLAWAFLQEHQTDRAFPTILQTTTVCEQLKMHVSEISAVKASI